MIIPIEIDVWQGDIAELEVDALIVPANESLFMTTPIGRAVTLRAGEGVERDAVSQGPIAAGTAIATDGGLLAAPYVIHAVGVGHDLLPDRERLGEALRASLEIAARLGLRRLATAPVGTERGVFSGEEAAGVLAALIEERRSAGEWLPTSPVVAVGSPAAAAAYRQCLEAIRAAAQ